MWVPWNIFLKAYANKDNLPAFQSKLFLSRSTKMSNGLLWRYSSTFKRVELFSVVNKRRRNTRYKNPQLVAQHCFVSSFRRCFPFFTLCDQLAAQKKKNICCGLKKVVAKSRARVYFGQQILVLLLVFHQTHNLSRNKFARALSNQPISAPHFFNPQQMFLLLLVFVAGQVDRARWKTGNIDKNLQRNNVARPVEDFCISCFAAFRSLSVGTLICGANLINLLHCTTQREGASRVCEREIRADTRRLHHRS